MKLLDFDESMITQVAAFVRNHMDKFELDHNQPKTSLDSVGTMDNLMNDSAIKDEIETEDLTFPQLETGDKEDSNDAVLPSRIQVNITTSSDLPLLALPVTPSKVIRIVEYSSESETERTPTKHIIQETNFLDCNKIFDNITEPAQETDPKNLLLDQRNNSDMIEDFEPEEQGQCCYTNEEQNDAEVEVEICNVEDYREESDRHTLSDSPVEIEQNAIENTLKEDHVLKIRDSKKTSTNYYKNKRLREKGAPYVGRSVDKNEGTKFVQKSERKIKPPCNSKFCARSKKRSCNEFSEQDRLQNFDEFWNHSWDEKKAVVRALIEKTEPTNLRGPGLASSKSNTLKYYLFKTDGKRYPVCKIFFCNTLGIDRGMVDRWMLGYNASKKGAEENQQETTAGKLVKKRKSKSEKQKVETEKCKKLEDFLDSLPRVPSHYCRASSTREYLERPFHSIRQVYRLYKEDVGYTPLSWAKFLNIFRQTKLSIFKPKKDQCNICSLSQEASTLTQHYQDNNEAQQEKRKDKEDMDQDTYVLCADVQSASPSPQLFVNATYYMSKLNCHNYTLCNLKNTNEVDCYFFSEDEAGLESDVFISCLLDHLSNNVLHKYPNIKRIILYTDSCPAQNKNVKLSNALLHFCISNNIVLEQKFLIVGHTYMEADEKHSMIERQCRKKIIPTPKDYVEHIVSCRLSGGKQIPYTVHYVKSQFFRSHKNEYYSNIRPGSKSSDPKVTDIRALRYEPTGLIFYKLSFLDVWSPLPNKLKKTVLKPSTQLYRVKPGITDSKRKHLMELCPYLPEYARDFYMNL